MQVSLVVRGGGTAVACTALMEEPGWITAAVARGMFGRSVAPKVGCPEVLWSVQHSAVAKVIPAQVFEGCTPPPVLPVAESVEI